MAKKQIYKSKEKELPKITLEEANVIQAQYELDLQQNLELSLEVDPTNKYNFSEQQKKFIEFYVQYKDTNFAIDRSKMEKEEALHFFVSYAFQEEMRRINRALCHRQFSHKLYTLDEIGSYLSALLDNEYIPLADQLNSADKLKAVKLLLDVQVLKQRAIENPAIIINNDINQELKDLSIDTIKNLLQTSKKEISVLENNGDEKLKKINSNELAPEEKEYLKSLPTKDLLDIINKRNKKRTKTTKVAKAIKIEEDNSAKN